jgi:hypothetical protein
LIAPPGKNIGTLVDVPNIYSIAPPATSSVITATGSRIVAIFKTKIKYNNNK